MEAAMSTGANLGACGYQAALETGMATLDLGASDAALPYFRRAAQVRPTAIAWTHIGRCLRDLGRLDEAELAYREALEAIGGDSGHALVGLVAVLCDGRQYETALPFARRAVIEHPDSAPAQTVAARCFDEFAATLGAGGAASSAALEPVRRVATEMRRRARELEPHQPADALQWRRERPFPPPVAYAHILTANAEAPDQGTSAPACEITLDDVKRDSSLEQLSEERTVGLWRRLLRMLGGRGSSR